MVFIFSLDRLAYLIGRDMQEFLHSNVFLLFFFFFFNLALHSPVYSIVKYAWPPNVHSFRLFFFIWFFYKWFGFRHEISF